MSFPRLVYRPTDVIRPDVPGWDYKPAPDAEAFEAALADGWQARPEKAQPREFVPVTSESEPGDAEVVPVTINSEVRLDIPLEPKKRGRPRKSEPTE